MVLNEPRRSESVRALSKGGRLLPPLLARLIPNRAILVASGLLRSARNAGTCSVGATLGLYSKLMSERVRLRGISLHSLRPRIRLHMAGMAHSVSPRGMGAAGPRDIYGRCGSLGIMCATPARATPLKRAFLLRGSDQPEGAFLPLPSQLSMFADESARPEGLHYWPDFISAQEEAALIGHIRALPLAPFQFGIYEGKRRVVFFGSRYDFTHQRLEAAEELPVWLVPLAGRVECFAALPSGSIKHALCTEYDVGAGIGWHRDKKHFDQVFGLSLGSACKFR